MNGDAKMKKNPVQVHHLSLEPEITVKIFRSEHFWITRLSWFKSLSPGAKKAIKYILKTMPTRKIG